MPSARLLVRMSGKLDCIQSGADVKVFGLKKTSQPATFVGEPHGQHLSQGLDETRVGLCDTQTNVSRGDTSLPAPPSWAYLLEGGGTGPPPSGPLDHLKAAPGSAGTAAPQ